MATWKFPIAAERLAQPLGTIYTRFLTVVSVAYNFYICYTKHMN